MQNFAVLFDMDGLMLDTERMARAAWTRALAEHGYEMSEVQFLELLGRTIEDNQKILGGYYGEGFSFEQVYKQRQAYFEADIETNGIPVKTGLVELLDFLDANQIPKAVASSSPTWFARLKLERAGLLHRFEVITNLDHVKAGKPAPDLFQEAARRLGYPTRLCVALEDSEAGILSAHAAGALAIMIPDLKPPAPEISALAYAVLPSLHEAIPLFEEFLQEGLPVV